MPLWVPKKGVLRTENNIGAVGTATPGTSVTTGGAAGTKGSYAQLIASTAFETYFIVVMAANYNSSATACEGAMDIAIGAATEEIIIPDLLFGYAGGAGSPIGATKVWGFPLYIAAGTKISARACGARTSTAFRVSVFLFGGDGSPPFRVGSKVTTYGVSVPNGTAITPGASGAEGAWTQITASTSEDHFAFFPSFQLETDTTASNSWLAVDIGVGSATEEELGTWLYSVNSNESMQGPITHHIPAFADVPSGTRLAMRASNNTTNDAQYGGAIHAVS